MKEEKEEPVVQRKARVRTGTALMETERMERGGWKEVAAERRQMEGLWAEQRCWQKPQERMDVWEE